MKPCRRAHLTALLTVLIWGTTFIATKILLTDFKPIEILFLRFFLGLLTLSILYPHRMGTTNFKQELVYAIAGLTGVTLYYLLENISLTYTVTSNVSIIVSTAPFFTAMLSCIFLKEAKLKWQFFLGLVLALGGIFLLSFNGEGMSFNPGGDLLALGAAICWGIYSVLKKISEKFGHNIISVTRRIFFYGLVFMIPAMFAFGFRPLQMKLAVTNIKYLFNILFLSIGASALCFVTWNYSIEKLGTVKSSVYVYLTPVVTVIASAIVLKEHFTLFTFLGIALTLAGLICSEKGQTLIPTPEQQEKMEKEEKHLLRKQKKMAKKVKKDTKKAEKNNMENPKVENVSADKQADAAPGTAVNTEPADGQQ